MSRVNLSINNDLFAKIEKEAKEKSTTINLLIIDLLEKLYGNDSFNYSLALKKLVDEAENYANTHQQGAEFTLVMLPSFADICVAQAGNAQIRPSMARARLGKMFNTMVRKKSVKGVSRSMDNKGNLKFIEKTAVFVVD